MNRKRNKCWVKHNEVGKSATAGCKNLGRDQCAVYSSTIQCSAAVRRVAGREGTLIIAGDNLIVITILTVPKPFPHCHLHRRDFVHFIDEAWEQETLVKCLKIQPASAWVIDSQIDTNVTIWDQHCLGAMYK